MSQAKDDFYKILVPKIEAFGFEFKKNKTSFLKIENGLEYQIGFRWDGRGGITMLDSIEAFIFDVAVRETIKKRTKKSGLPHVMSGWGYCTVNAAKIPVMYSKVALDLANNMNFKALSQMPQDEKYPSERILSSANFVEKLILEQVFPFLDSFKNTIDIYNHLLEKTKDIDAHELTEPMKELLEEYTNTAK